MSVPLFKQKTRVLFVCTENICRSPLAEGLFRHHLKQAGLAGEVVVNSAGTHVSQPGARPDVRAMRLASSAGISLGRIKASQVTEKDLIASDLIFAMERRHVDALMQICPEGHEHKISLLLTQHHQHRGEGVPDPYYGSYDGFVDVFQIIDSGVASLLTHFGSRSA